MRRAYVIVRVPGPAWDHDRGMREQDGWDAHAAFMDGLAAEGFIVLGGPLGEGEHRVLHIVDAPDEPTVRARLDDDPWTPDLLVLESVEPWEILLERG